MTAILAMNLGDRVVMMSDTACLSTNDNSIAFFGTKMIDIPAAQSVIAVTGLGFLELFLANLSKEGREFKSADDLWSRLPSELRTFHEATRHLYPRNPNIENGGVDNFTIVVATGGAHPRVGEMQGPYGSGQAEFVRPWVLQDSNDHPFGRAERWLVMTGFGETQLPDEFVMPARLCSLFTQTHGPLPFDTGTAGLAYFEAVRGTRFLGGYFGVGGQLEEASISLSGAITRRTLFEWTEDIACHPIRPAGADGGVYGQSLNLSDMGNKNAARDNLSIKGADIASAATVNLETSTGSFVTVTGTTTTTAITLSDGHQRLVRAAAAWPLTHGANLQIQGGASYTCAAGDILLVQADGAVVRVTIFSIAGSIAANDSITNAKLANMATATIKGRATAGTGDPEDLTAAQVRSLLALVVGTDVQAYDTQLAALAGLTGAVGSFVRWTGASAAVMQAIVGTVSQSSGVPTGAVIEAGSNANGNYTKFADGTMICWGTVASRSVARTTSFGSILTSSGAISITYPATFAVVPSLSVQIFGSGGQWAMVSASTASGGAWYIADGTSRTTNLIDNWVAIGRWF